MFSRKFMQLLQLMKAPPPIVQRVRYLMGEETRGGGMRVVCQDPANNQLLHVVSVPLSSAGDEAEFNLHVGRMFGNTCASLVKVLECTTFQLRDFNYNGFTSTNERSALVIMEYHDGPPLLTFLQENWDETTNEQLRDYLKQFVAGIAALHLEGLIHRNIHPGCVSVEARNTKKMMSAVVDPLVRPTRNKAAKDLQEKPVIRLGDFNFLHNPRKLGCGASFGRADWGDLATAPPEAMAAQQSNASSSSASSRSGGGGLSRSASSANAGDAAVGGSRRSRVGAGAGAADGADPMRTITVKSDIFAFGMVAYHLCTRGRPIPSVMQLGPGNLAEQLRVHVPVRWDSWLHTLLNMCLQRDPRLRATAQEISFFLGGSFVKKPKI
jgi:serine/threonine protein kinase